MKKARLLKKNKTEAQKGSARVIWRAGSRLGAVRFETYCQVLMMPSSITT